MLSFKKIFGQKYNKPSSIQNQAQKILNLCLGCVFFVGVILTTMYATGFTNNNDQSNPLPINYIPDSVKIMLVDEFMEWNGFQIATYDPSEYDPTVSPNTSHPKNNTSSKPSSINNSNYMDEKYLEDLQKQVSKEDKKKIFNIMTARLTRSEMNRFIKLSQNGVTAAEKAEVKSLLKTRLSSTETEQLRAIYSKYQ